LAFVLSKLRSPRERKLLGSGIEQRGRFEGVIDPHEKVAIDEQLLTQQCGEIRQTPSEAGAQLQVLQQ